MAKTRAQRKAEQRARQAAGQQERQDESRAQHATQVPESAEVAEAKVVEETGLSLEELHSPAPSRADAPPPAAASKPSRRERAEEKRRQQAVAQQATRQKERKATPAAPKERERSRGAVLSFFASSWAELKRVQWPDRETLVQASAVTIVFVAVAAAYLGALDAAFSFLVKRVL